MGVCGCVIPSPDCHCHFTPVGDWQYNNSTNHLVTMPKDVLDQIGKEHTDEIERLREELKISNDGWGFASLQIQVAKLEIERLRSDNKRLRDRMEKVADVLYDKGDMDAWAAVRNALWQDDE